MRPGKNPRYSRMVGAVILRAPSWTSMLATKVSRPTTAPSRSVVDWETQPADGVKPRKSMPCCVANAVALASGANALLGTLARSFAGLAASREYFALTAAALYHLALGMRISKWQCEPVASA